MRRRQRRMCKMADILIRGMEMPNSCGKCKLRERNVDAFVPFDKCFFTKRNVDPWSFGRKDGYPDDCPLVELPEHGDLIDRSKLSFVCGGTAPMEMDYVRRYVVDGMPVVIQSNKEEIE